MAQNKTNLKEVPKQSKEEVLTSLITQYAELQREEGEIRKAKEHLRAEIESRFPPIKDGEKESVVETNGITAKLYYSGITVVDPELLYDISEYRDAFWRLVKIPTTDAKNILPGDVLHVVSRVTLSPKATLLIKAKKD